MIVKSAEKQAEKTKALPLKKQNKTESNSTLDCLFMYSFIFQLPTLVHQPPQMSPHTRARAHAHTHTQDWSESAAENRLSSLLNICGCRSDCEDMWGEDSSVWPSPRPGTWHQVLSLIKSDCPHLLLIPSLLWSQQLLPFCSSKVKLSCFFLRHSLRPETWFWRFWTKMCPQQKAADADKFWLWVKV